MKKLLFSIIGAIISVWVATILVPGVHVTVLSDSNFFGIPLTSQWHIVLLLGIIFGLLFFFVKPILNIITLPLRIITLGLFNFVIIMGFIFVVSLFVKELDVPLLLPLIYTALIMWGVNIGVGLLSKN